MKFTSMLFLVISVWYLVGFFALGELAALWAFIIWLVVALNLMFLGMETPKKPWFTAKTFGWGWTPATWQGWMMTLLMVELIIVVVFVSTLTGDTARQQLYVAFPFLALIISTMAMINYRTGEKAKWGWFKRNK